MFDDYFALDPNAQSSGSYDFGFEELPEEPPINVEDPRWEDYLESGEAWATGNYGPDLEHAPSSEETLWFDLSYDLRQWEGNETNNENAWEMVWDLSGALLGIDDIQNNEFWSNVVFDAIMDALYGDDWDWCEDDEYTA